MSETDPTKHHKEEEEVISIKKIKDKVSSFFSAKETKEEHATHHAPETKGDAFSFDLKKGKEWYHKHQKWITPLVLIMIVILISSYLRWMPVNLPITDDWAQSTAENFYRSQIEQAVAKQYPNLPQQNRDALVETEFKKFLEQNGVQVKTDTEQLSQQYRSQFQDEEGHTYLLEIDPYLWFSQARNVIEHGHLGDKIIDGKSHFSLRNGRVEKVSSVQWHPYVAAYFYRFLHIFNSDITLMRSMFFLPVVLMGLAVIPAFFIGRRLGGNVGGFFAALLIVINGPLLGRTPAGFSDTDSYSILYPLFIAWLTIEAYHSSDLKRKLLFGGVAGLLVGIYAATWTGWSTIFLFILLALFITVVLTQAALFLKKKEQFKSKENRKHLQGIGLFVGAFLVSSGIFVSWFVSSWNFFNGFTRPIRFITLKTVGVKTIWPNVLTTVAEFNTTSFSNIISQVGGPFFFWLGLMGIVVLLTRGFKGTKDKVYLILCAVYYVILIALRDQLNNPVFFILMVSIPFMMGALKVLYYHEDVELMYPVLLGLWLLGTAYAFKNGVRFAIFIVPPFALSVGSSVGFFYERAVDLLSKGIHVNVKIAKGIVILILCLLVLSPFSQAQQIAKSEVPLINDAWVNTLTKIKEDSSNGLITSWWDYGHWFAAIGQRKVTFDGGDQGERIHWVGKSLLTNNEDEAVGILRMLNCAQEDAPHKLEEYMQGDTLKAINTLYSVFKIHDPQKAEEKYEELGLTPAQAQVMVKNYTHCPNLLPNYFITSEDMIGKAGVWGHFGAWNFEKAKMYQSTVNLETEDAITHLTQNFNLSQEEALKIHTEIRTANADSWIAPWPGYVTGVRGCNNVSATALECTGSIQGKGLTFHIDLSTMNVSIEDNPTLAPNSIVYFDGTKIVEKDLPGTPIGFSLVLIPQNGNYAFLLADRLQAASTFTKLFFFEGKGSKCFEKFYDTRQVTGQRILTWKIDYTCSQVQAVE